jgi:PTS system mannose-specific IIB component
MAYVLVRIDDRLIHGQVTVAWGSDLAPDRIILVNDEVAGNEWRRSLYAETDALGASVSVLSTDEFLEGDRKGDWESERAMVLVESPRDLLRLIEGGLAIDSANVGGLHFSEGKRELLPYFFVDADDLAAIRAILARGTRLEARDVPHTNPVDVASLIAGLDDGAGREEQ